MSIGLVTVAYGRKYQDMLPDWAASVAALTRKPDVITIIGDKLPSEVAAQLDALLDYQFVQTDTKPETHAQVLLNEAIAHTETDWIVKLDADDAIFAHALDELDECDADIYMFGAKVNTQDVPAKDVTAIDILANGNNLLVPASPFRRWVWQAAPFRDMIFEDWAFWIEAAANGAKFYRADGVHYLYNMQPTGAYQSSDWGKAELKVLEVRRLVGALK